MYKEYEMNVINFTPALLLTGLSLLGLLMFTPTHWFIPLIPIIFGIFLSSHLFYTDYKALQKLSEVAE